MPTGLPRGWLVASAFAAAVVNAQTYSFNLDDLPPSVAEPGGYRTKLVNFGQVQLEGGYVLGPNTALGTTSNMYALSPYCIGCQACPSCEFRPVLLWFKDPANELSFDLYNYLLNYQGYKKYWTVFRIEFSPTYVGPWTDLNPAPLFTVAKTTQNVTLPDGITGVRVYPPHWADFEYGLDNIVFKIAEPEEKYTVVIESADPYSSFATQAQITATGSVKLQLTLGLAVKISVNNSDGSLLAHEVAFSDHDLENGIDETIALFPDAAAAVLGATGPTLETTLAVFHRGISTGILNVDGKSIDLEVSAVAPTAMGSEGNQFDQVIFDVAHKRGIPPQWVKAQIGGEAEDWNPESYRYEPLSIDLTYKEKLRLKGPYKRYRLATGAADGDLPKGKDLIDADIVPRAKMRVSTPPGSTQLSPITLDMQCPVRCISVRDIYDANLKIQRWDQPGVGNPAKAKWIKEQIKNGQPDPLNFTAQTTTAGSYGLMQVLYSTAISQLDWLKANSETDEKPVNPSFLFDTPDNIANGNGSLGLGTAHTIIKMNKKAFDSLADFTAVVPRRPA